MYIDQIIDTELNILLDWNLIKTLCPGTNKGRTPTWFIVLKNKLTSNGQYIL